MNASEPGSRSKGVTFNQVVENFNLLVSGEYVGHCENLSVAGGFR
jgi:hypothetical protein